VYRGTKPERIVDVNLSFLGATSKDFGETD
jgi:hypothetical protein